MRRTIAAFLVALSVIPQVTSAQAVMPGTRVRVTHPGEGTRTGTVVALTADTLEVILAGRSEPAHLPLAQVTRLDVSRGVEHRVLARAGVGFLVGATLGAVGGAISESDCSSREIICLGASGGALVGGVFFGSVGGLIGLIAGAMPSEKWERVPTQGRRISLVAPSGRHGRGVGLRFAF